MVCVPLNVFTLPIHTKHSLSLFAIFHVNVTHTHSLSLSLSLSLPDSAEEGAGRFWDELSHVGLPDSTDIQTLFDESGEAPRH